jgi:hypothetical protein
MSVYELESLYFIIEIIFFWQKKILNVIFLASSKVVSKKEL